MASTGCHTIYTADGSLPWWRNLALEDSLRIPKGPIHPVTLHRCLWRWEQWSSFSSFLCTHYNSIHVFKSVEGGRRRAWGTAKPTLYEIFAKSILSTVNNPLPLPLKHSSAPFNSLNSCPYVPKLEAKLG